MEKTINHTREIVIIGGGPAGLSAAIEAAENGADVLVIDENLRPGGQLFKQIHKFFGSSAHNAGMRGMDIGQHLLKETKRLKVEVWLNTPAIGIFSDRRVTVVRNGVTETITAKKILICTGAVENSINFPGWTLPGVMGAGAAQTMVNINRVLPGKRVLIIGSGNVGVIVAYQLLQAGAEVLGIIEGLPRIGAYGVHASKIRRAGVPFFLEHTIVRANGNHKVESAVIAQTKEFKPIPGTELEVDTDLICIAAGLRPLTEFARMASSRHEFIPELGGWMPMHDENMESSESGIYIAGDTAGVEEASTAMEEGRLAGIAMVESLGYITAVHAENKKIIVRERLQALRQGPFGQRRRDAKSRILNGELRK